MIKAVKINSFDDFLDQHPELIPVYDAFGNVKSIQFPSNATETSFTNVLGSIKVYYFHNGNYVRFPET